MLRKHFLWLIANLLHKNLVLRNNFRVTKKFLITKFDCNLFSNCSWSQQFQPQSNPELFHQQCFDWSCKIGLRLTSNETRCPQQFPSEFLPDSKRKRKSIYVGNFKWQPILKNLSKRTSQIELTNLFSNRRLNPPHWKPIQASFSPGAGQWTLRIILLRSSKTERSTWVDLFSIMFQI